MYNIHAMFLTDAERDQLTKHLQKLKPGAVLVMDHPGYAIHLAGLLPQTVVIHRRSGDDNAQNRYSPQEWFNANNADCPASTGVWWYANNEPGTSQDVFDFAYSCAKLAADNGGRSVQLNFSVGVPEPADWQKGRALLQLAASKPNQVIIGLHEYAPSFVGYELGLNPSAPETWPAKINGASWLLSRYRTLLSECDKMAIKRPRIVITEASFDYIHAAASFQDALPRPGNCESAGALWCNVDYWQQVKPSNVSWEQYAVNQMHWIWTAINRNDPEIVGVTNFCWGAQGGSRWELYDLKRVPNIMSMMEAKNWSKASAPVPPDPEPPDPTPEPTPPSDLAWPVTLVWGVPMKFRPSPTTGIAHTAVIPANAPVALETTNVQTNGGYVWMHVRYGTKTGYVALGEAP